MSEFCVSTTLVKLAFYLLLHFEVLIRVVIRERHIIAALVLDHPNTCLLVVV